MIHCGETTEAFFDANGNETVAKSYSCDSVLNYEVRNGMLKIRLLKQPPEYYKVQIKGEMLELKPIGSEDYNK